MQHIHNKLKLAIKARGAIVALKIAPNNNAFLSFCQHWEHSSSSMAANFPPARWEFIFSLTGISGVLHLQKSFRNDFFFKVCYNLVISKVNFLIILQFQAEVRVSGQEPFRPQHVLTFVRTVLEP